MQDLLRNLDLEQLKQDIGHQATQVQARLQTAYHEIRLLEEQIDLKRKEIQFWKGKLEGYSDVHHMLGRRKGGVSDGCDEGEKKRQGKGHDPFLGAC